MDINIVLIAADTARARNFSLYGYDKKTTPNLESIAKESTLYTSTIATAPWTMPSHASIFTGQYSCNNGSTRDSPQISQELNTLHKTLAGIGYTNWLITANPGISSVTNGDFKEYLTRRLIPTDTDFTDVRRARTSYGFRPRTLKSVLDLVMDDGELGDIINLADRFVSNRISDWTLNPRRFQRKGSRNNLRLFSKLCHQSNSPFFAYVNIMEPHLEYVPPKKYRQEFIPDHVTREELQSVNQDPRLFNRAKAVSMNEKDFELLEGLYNGAIRYTDHLVGKMIDHLKSNDLFDQTLFIFIGDHGENIGDKGLIGHSNALNDALLRVPMLISYPDHSGGKKLDQLVQLHDIFPTVLREVNVNNKYDDLNIDAIPLPKNNSDPGRDFAVAEYLGYPTISDRLKKKYPSVDYSQYNFEIKTIYSEKSEKLTIYSTGESRLSKVDINGETELESYNKSDKIDSLQRELFSRVDNFTRSRKDVRSRNIDENIENKLKDLGYI